VKKSLAGYDLWLYYLHMSNGNDAGQKKETKMEIKINYAKTKLEMSRKLETPIILTDAHPLSSYGQPVAIYDGEAVSYTQIKAMGIVGLHNDFDPADAENPARKLTEKANRLLDIA
jgi:hypothetical protein